MGTKKSYLGRGRSVDGGGLAVDGEGPAAGAVVDGLLGVAALVVLDVDADVAVLAGDVGIVHGVAHLLWNGWRGKY